MFSSLKTLLIRVRDMLWWFFLNNVGKEQIPGREKYFRSFDDCEYIEQKSDAILTFAKGEYETSLKAIDEAQSRLEKLITVTLVALGWVSTRPEVFSLAITFLIVSSIAGVLGRAALYSFRPGNLRAFLELQKSKKAWEWDDVEYSLAKLYSSAAYANHHVVAMTHMRLLLSIGLLIAGLVCLALRC